MYKRILINSHNLQIFYVQVYDYTLGMKISDKKVVVRMKYPETMIPAPMLI